MSQPCLSAEELMIWNERTSQAWRSFLAEHPEALTLTCDIAGTKVSGELFQHIVAAELRYAERLAELPVSDYSAVPYDSAEALYAVHDRASAILRGLLADETIDWDGKIDFMTRTLGPMRSTRRAVLFHSQLHGIRHYAQLATLMRQRELPWKWPLDYLALHEERLV